MSRLTLRWPVLAYPDFRRVMLVRLATTFCIQVQLVAMGWQIYDISREPLYLGLIGLAQFLPAVLLILVTGAAADRFQRRSIVFVCLAAMALSAVALAALSLSDVRSVWPFLAMMGVIGTARAFLNPALQALIPNVVPTPHLGNAVALNSIAARTGASIGPLAGGLLYDLSAAVPYGAVAATFLAATMVAAAIRRTDQRSAILGVSLQVLTAGLRYIWNTKVILGAISLDIFALVMGGVTALLPVFARDILHAGPIGLGLLRAGPAVGGMGVALYLAAFPIRERAGVVMFAAVALFGVSIVVFGLSTELWLSIAALTVMGASDMASVNIRWTLAQLWTPDHVRGRVSAVTAVSASGSTELGDFRAGLSAAALGPVVAVVAGGLLILAGVAFWMRQFPELLRVRDLSQGHVGSSRVDLQACKLEYSIVSPK